MVLALGQRGELEALRLGVWRRARPWPFGGWPWTPPFALGSARKAASSRRGACHLGIWIRDFGLKSRRPVLPLGPGPGVSPAAEAGKMEFPSYIENRGFSSSGRGGRVQSTGTVGLLHRRLFHSLDLGFWISDLHDLVRGLVRGSQSFLPWPPEFSVKTGFASRRGRLQPGILLKSTCRPKRPPLTKSA